jgi:GNAT superfamily N-acetyltransferase
MTIIRPARAEDAERIAVLCGQLGYPASHEQVRCRLDQIQQDDEQAVYVAQRPDGRMIGWVQIFVRHLLVVARHAELGGLVVDEDHRDGGVGRLLMEQAERWAREKKCESVYVRSNVVRERAHRFYERLGYANVKTSLTFHKVLK